MRLINVKQEVLENYPLKNLNSFGIHSTAKAFFRIESEAQLPLLPDLLSKYQNYFILGGGSNVLLPDFFDGLVVKIDIEKLSVRESKYDVLVNVGAGNNWHQLVSDMVENNYGGIENLALIPGSAGAAPIQNIGAYGVELKDVFVCLRGYDMVDKEFRCFNLIEADFGYRDSVFKRDLKERFIISEIWLRLSKAAFHEPNLSYSALNTYLKEKIDNRPSISQIYRAVIEIRRSKLPDPSETGNAGSFFKNPVVGKSTVDQLHNEFPDLVFYPAESGHFKIPAGWLIEKAGLKGFERGEVATYHKQALVIINKGNATASEVIQFSGFIQSVVFDKFGIELLPEVNIIGDFPQE